jgi:hypothetical protein
MKIDYYGDRIVLSYNYESEENLIAEILNKKEEDNYVLILYPRPSGRGKTSHNNRIWGVLKEIGGDYNNMRYSSYIRYCQYVNDKRLQIDYQLEERPLKFNCVGGKLFIDYANLESHATPKEEQPPVVEPNDNGNIKNELDRLTNILTTI